MSFTEAPSSSCHCRWGTASCNLYSKDPFAQMIVIFAASNPHAPAFLEAALIEKFGSWQGCKNERRGGDTVKEIDGGPYLTYIVFQSWKRPSMQVRSRADQL
ncbi:unnamed protein product [Cladocopium goreaui]|uniref:Uncharacterized protein n=1 Tax=Cladocopium goreaui TaxID=2562237 RepID=A0A9P1DR54_9DINO|nr:unnamed protein product [Cladocopium goreaui]